MAKHVTAAPPLSALSQRKRSLLLHDHVNRFSDLRCTQHAQRLLVAESHCEHPASCSTLCIPCDRPRSCLGLCVRHCTLALCSRLRVRCSGLLASPGQRLLLFKPCHRSNLEVAESRVDARAPKNQHSNAFRLFMVWKKRNRAPCGCGAFELGGQATRERAGSMGSNMDVALRAMQMRLATSTSTCLRKHARPSAHRAICWFALVATMMAVSGSHQRSSN